ncbi:MAG: N-acetyltransferase [Rhizobium sp.]|nr:MAG: N-acetyltransferase [Rhizobium sp.]
MVIMKSIPRSRIVTKRLHLLPTTTAYAVGAWEIQRDWDVARMLSNATYPPDREDIESWFSSHEREWADGKAYRFAIEQAGRMIGIVDVDGIDGGVGSLGYWLEKATWGKGYAYEAAQALVAFVFQDVGLSSLESGHASDNPVSGRILARLGFRRIGSRPLFSRSRRETIMQCCYMLEKERPLAKPKADTRD